MKRLIVKFFNAYWLKEYIMLFRYYKLTSSFQHKKMLISVVDNRRNCQGLADRFKGIVSIYALSKALGMDFRCLYSYPFQLSDFLIPNEYNWLPEKDEISNSIKDVRFRIMRKELSVKRLTRVFPSNKQWHVYANVDYIEEINQLYSQDFQWGKLFHELFKPTKELEQKIQSQLSKVSGNDFIACAFRFQSMLGDFNEYNAKSLNENDKETLIEKNFIALKNIVESVNCLVLVTSDSATFLSKAKSLDRVFTLPGKIVHVDCVTDEQREVYMKLFVDFFMLSCAKKVYSIGTKQMYPSNFPVYAAKINDIPFERILID